MKPRAMNNKHRKQREATTTKKHNVTTMKLNRTINGRSKKNGKSRKN